MNNMFSPWLQYFILSQFYISYTPRLWFPFLRTYLECEINNVYIVIIYTIYDDSSLSIRFLCDSKISSYIKKCIRIHAKIKVYVAFLGRLISYLISY